MMSFLKKIPTPSFLSQALKVEADFKTVKVKFVNQGAPQDEVDLVLKDFRELKDKQRIKDNKDKDIDAWGKKPFEDLKAFVSKLKGEKSETQKKTETKSEGAKLVAENKNWRLYQITDHKACMLYGKGTKWCITEKEGSHWSNYIRKNDFYFYVSKNRKPTDKWFKIAMNINMGGIIQYWDAQDNLVESPPKNLYLPSFKPAPKAPREGGADVEGLVERLNEMMESEEAYRTDPYQNDYDYYLYEDLNWEHVEVDSDVEANINIFQKYQKNWEKKIKDLCHVEISQGRYDGNTLATWPIGSIEITLSDTDWWDEIEALDEDEFKEVQQGVNFYISKDRQYGTMELDEYAALIINEEKLKNAVKPFLDRQIKKDVPKILKKIKIEAPIVYDGGKKRKMKASDLKVGYDNDALEFYNENDERTDFFLLTEFQTEEYAEALVKALRSAARSK